VFAYQVSAVVRWVRFLFKQRRRASHISSEGCSRWIIASSITSLGYSVNLRRLK
jgi:hypothetical protein